MTMVKVYKNGTNVRRGGSTKGVPDNILTVINAGEYEAYVQCAGEEIVEGGDRNFWWVLVNTPAGRGWVSAVRIASGGNDEPVPSVPTAATEFVSP